MKIKTKPAIIILILITIIGIYLFSQKNLNNMLNQQPISANISIPLSVEIETKAIVTNISKPAIKVKANQEITVESESSAKLYFSHFENANTYLYALEFSNVGIGISTKHYTIRTKDNQEEKHTLEITKEQYSLPFGLSEIEDWSGFSYYANGDMLNAKVSKKHKLVTDYFPKDLVDLNKEYLLYTNVPGILLRKEAADSLKVMLTDLKKATGKDIVIASGFRSFADQFKQYVYWVRELGQVEADKISARPGYSEHQLGTAIDFMSEDSGFDFTNELEKTVAGTWLRENSYKYGFVQSYPEGKSEITGYNHEAWHYRYIGISNAKNVKESNLTLIEWLNK